MEQFFAINGIQYLVFFYQEPDVDNHPTGSKENYIMKYLYRLRLADLLRPRYSPYSSRSGAGSIKSNKPKVIIANLDEQSLQGICLCFIRNSNKMIITEQNIENVEYSKSFDQIFHFILLRKLFSIHSNAILNHYFNH